jgi:hypothetical protein
VKSFVIPVALLLLGLGGGVGAGLMFPTAPPAGDDGPGPCGDVAAAAPAAAGAHGGGQGGREYVRLNNQFVVPVVEAGRVAALVVLSISLEVATGKQDLVFSREPKLRDSFLRVLFDHANTGGFSGMFTAATTMRALREMLLQAAQEALGPTVTDVLIIDLVRQDV